MSRRIDVLCGKNVRRGKGVYKVYDVCSKSTDDGLSINFSREKVSGDGDMKLADRS